jgi:L-threonylcarbamoyladenylate synthase
MGKKILTLGIDDYSSVLNSCKSALEMSSGFILIPTETVYGLACLWDNETAKNCIYQAKARPEHKPFQMLACSTEMAKRYGCTIDRRTEKIMDAFCPGPITIVVPACDGSKIGFRIPEHKFVLDLILYMGKPLAASSANVSGEMPALNIKNALSAIKMRPALAIDGGPLQESSLASTVIEVIDSGIRVLREGPITLSAILKILK